MNAALLPLALLLLSWVLAPHAAAPPLRVMLLVDISGSTIRGPIFFTHPRLRGRWLDVTLMTDAVRAIEPALDNDDELYLAVVADQPMMTTGPVRGSSLQAAAETLTATYGGRSPLWDALYHASGRLEQAEGPRAIILVTDGRSNANERSFAEALQRLTAAGVRVFPVTRDEGRRKLDPDPLDRLRQLASATGGEHLTFRPGKLDEAFAQVMRSAHRAAAPR
jgi:hypothetical protein